MKKLSSILLGLAVLAITSCERERLNGDGPIITETRDKSNFTEVQSSISGTVYVKQHATYKVEVSGQQNILNILQTDVINNKLVIKYKPSIIIRKHENVTVNIFMPDVSALNLGGSGNIRGLNIFNTKSLKLDIGGSGNIDLPGVTAKNITAEISGSGNINVVNGTTDYLRLKIEGSGSLDLLNVAATEAITETNGSGQTKLTATQKLHATINGSGSVYYKGNPVVNTVISGSGSVRRY